MYHPNIRLGPEHILRTAVELYPTPFLANPAAAHRNYDQDERVIEIIAHGVGRAGVSPLLDERCSWVETVDFD